MSKGLQRKPNESDEQYRQREAVAERMGRVKRKYVVLSGKGGVGKSTVAANLALALSSKEKKTGLLDIDIHGPSVPRLFGLEDSKLAAREDTIIPAEYKGLKIMSIGFTLKNRDDAVIWRGPMKYAAIRQFLGDVEWGELEYLIVDSPPGTGDEPLSVIQLIGDAEGAIIVTTPQQLSISDVRKSITFCRKLELPVTGVVENMSGFVCPECGNISYIFDRDGGKKMAEEMDVPFLGRIPIEPGIVSACDSGTPFITEHTDTEAAAVFERIADGIAEE